MVICDKCLDKGFVEYETHRNGRYFVQIFKCCNEYKYNKEVMRRHSKEKPQEEPKVLKFRSKDER